MNINVENSPGAQVFVSGNGDVVNVPEQYFNAAKRIHKFLDKVAKLVERAAAQQIEITTDFTEAAPSLDFDQENQNLFEVKFKEQLQEAPYDFECNIYKLDVKNNTGRLEYYDEVEEKNIWKDFEFESNLAEKCAQALSAQRIIANVNPFFKINAFDKRTVKKFLLNDINI
jgi:hypothetical protein